jgi:xanthine dehydrogenase accessory factor
LDYSLIVQETMMKSIYQDIKDLHLQGEDFVLAMILTSTGSAPRRAGARMVVRCDGRIKGTIGGGILEALVQRRAKDVFETRKTQVLDYNLSNKDAAQIGMICGGQVRVLLEYIEAADPVHLQLVEKMLANLEGHRKIWLITPIPEGAELNLQPAHCLVTGGEDTAACWGMSGSALNELARQAQTNAPAVVEFQDRQFLSEPVFTAGTLYIFGGGHIGQKLAPLATQVGFNTVVMDDREEFISKELFPTADRLIKVDNFRDVFDELAIDPDSYLVIVTRGHAHDKTVLAQALKTKAGYIGMIGSKTKCQTTFQNLIEEGFSSEGIKKVHAPIGLEIGAETPEEIAISILAELIKVRAGLG